MTMIVCSRRRTGLSLNALKKFIEDTGAEMIPEPDDDVEITSCDPYDPEEWDRPRRIHPEVVVRVDGGYL
jgi:hypothetical protein